MAALSRNDPFAKVASIPQLSGVRFPSTVGGELTLRVVIGQLRESEWPPFAANVRQVNGPAQRASRAYGCILVPKLDDRPDNHSAMFAPSIWARLSPSVFPNVGTAPTLASHDAAVLHELNLRLHFGSHHGQSVLTGTIQAQITVPPRDWEPVKSGLSACPTAFLRRNDAYVQTKGARSRTGFPAASDTPTSMLKRPSRTTKLAALRRGDGGCAKDGSGKGGV